MNLQAGYISDAIANVLKNRFPEDNIFLDQTTNQEILKLKGLLEFISNFNISTSNNFEIDYNDIPKILAVQNNVITRGLPTRSPVFLEQLMVDIGLTVNDNSKIYEFKYKSNNEFLFENVFKKLHIIYPKLDVNSENYLGKLDSQLERKFLENSHPLFKQILQSQREFNSIVVNSNKKNWVDFSFTIPYLFSEKIKTPFKDIVDDNIYKIKVLEIDGPHHFLKENIYYDALRDEQIEEANGEVFRYPYYEEDKDGFKADNSIDEIIKNIFLENYESDFSKELDLLTSLFLPISVARLQKFFNELLIRKPEYLQVDKLNICVIERDLPGGAIALKLFQDFIINLNNLVDDDDKISIPNISLTIIQNKEWIYDTKINLEAKLISFDEFNKDDYDVVIDNSILLREGVYDFKNTVNKNYYTLRSVHYIDPNTNNLRQIYCNKSIKYKPLVVRNPDTSYSEIRELLPSIEFFLQNIFRKKNFREGQLPIISRALQKLPVIGLLPTGGGKSLTFQIPVFLQPTISIVVDPIKSLMEDQVRVLRENWIDSVSYANSSQSQYLKNKAIIDFKLGSKQLMFVSPERFVIDSFRKLLSNIDSTKRGQSIGYCVVDEVHCVSEWGHDFRYDYLLLGKNAQEYCSTKDEVISLMGLTATASFDVLADIERELQINSNDVSEAIIMIENTVRPELFFRVVDVTGVENRSDVLLSEMNNFNTTFDYFNNKELLILSQKHHFENFDPKDFAATKSDSTYLINENNQYVFQEKLNQLVTKLPEPYSSIIFCPVKGTKRNEKTGEFSNRKGVRYNHELLEKNAFKSGYFYGLDEDNVYEDTSQEKLQKYFHQFLNGNLSTMVCTKAFGMGIDKDDIRATFHVNYSSSLESLVQECGRAGRDKKVAIANILASYGTYFSFDYLKFTDYYKGLSDFDIKIIRENLTDEYIDGEFVLKKYSSKEEFLAYVDECEFLFKAKGGQVYTLSEYKIKTIREKINNHVDELLIEKSSDRDIHDFFFDNNFKGKKYESAQMEKLFTTSVIIDKEKEMALFEMLEEVSDNSYFEFIVPFKSKLRRFNFKNEDNKEKNKTTELSSYEKQLILDTPFFKDLYNNYEIPENKIYEAYRLYTKSRSIEEFWQKIETEKILSLEVINNLTFEQRYEIEQPYLSQRNTVETGRLIYRLHSIGFLDNYTKDYNKELYYCKFYKAESINYYLDKIEEFFKRYQSEKTVDESIKFLTNQLSLEEEDFFSDLLTVLKYLTNFTYTEIASKRRKATNEIKDLIERLILSDEDEYIKNLILKEEIYFYFNAKYARKGYIENGKEYSLVDDYYDNEMLDNIDILFKYIDDELLKFGTEQNNYKHLIGTCKKMLRNLTETENKKDWLLHLLLSFAFYSTNNLSYRYDANRTLENGFIRLLNNNEFMNDEFDKIIEIFDFYFDKLQENILEGNELIDDIHLIQNKVLQEIQSKMVASYINQIA
ncbi:DEAD/DEAH box helicase [Empedobacter falsenii]